MKTTVDISDSVVKELEKEATRQGCTVSKTALRALLQKQPPGQKLPPLPEFDAGEAKVDVADRDALYEVMEE